MGNASLGGHLVTTQKNGAIEGQGLSEFPLDLQKVSGCLRAIDVSNNQMEIVQPEASPDPEPQRQPPEGVALGLRAAVGPEVTRPLRNRLRALPPQLCCLLHLEEVDFSNNQIGVLPDFVGALQAVGLNLSQNRVVQIWARVARCPRLGVISLEGTGLELASLPPPPGLVRASRVCLLALNTILSPSASALMKHSRRKLPFRATATRLLALALVPNPRLREPVD
ncbi:leucine-rich repeat-containing protein 57-like [Myotis yumanensis]|uniref:leucine-rich repeat-containing protein 57-like n=1 Tax=Myotis yumanensis TaxID=159337 RepID=UPI0038D43024